MTAPAASPAMSTKAKVLWFYGFLALVGGAVWYATRNPPKLRSS